MMLGKLQALTKREAWCSNGRRESLEGEVATLLAALQLPKLAVPASGPSPPFVPSRLSVFISSRSALLSV